ncbi:MutL C-terminal dimerization domain protein [Eubacterium nodatum ATCC 33099]|nr:MutL C-terminal dimerization domain protein [Eubacterium nodatum ATCC 33099]
MIKILEKHIADKIAAGEVIERPISIIKELVENSIDAGATSITCEIKNGGKTYIRVTDNGCGIAREECETAFLRHATSKISTVNDLKGIKSLGFRGEALASIAAVTNAALITKTAESKTGCRLVLHGGETVENIPLGCPDGTTIIINDLFYNMPARREFLKSDGAESSLIIELISEMALAYTNIRFQLINNGKILFSTTGDGNLKNTINSVYMQREYKDLIEISKTEAGYSIRGCISKPSLSRTTKKNQVYFVNGRVVKSAVMEKGISMGYKERLFEGRYPVAFIFLNVNPETIDVNIHPNKKEVRFHDEDAIVKIIENATVEALASQDAVIEVRDYFSTEPSTNDAKKEDKSEQVDIKHILKSKSEKKQVDLKREKILYNSKEKDNYAYIDEIKESETGRNIVSDITKDYSTGNCANDDYIKSGNAKNQELPEKKKPVIEISEPLIRPFDFNDLKVTGCVFDTYITATDANSFYMIDQHAAQERIFYEQLVEEYLSDDKPSQSILTPIVIDVALEVKEEEYNWLDSLGDMGYLLEEFGPNSYIIKEIPYFMDITEAENFAKDYIEQTHSGIKINNKVVIDKLITRSCKSAIKAHDKLSQEAMESLINELKYCRNPFSCPHGRPTFIKFSNYDIEKMFKRV